MTDAPPFSRRVRVDALPADGLTQTIEASPDERAALAALNRLPAIASLTASFTRAAQRPRRRAGDRRSPRRSHPGLRRQPRAVRGDGRRAGRRAFRAGRGGRGGAARERRRRGDGRGRRRGSARSDRRRQDRSRRAGGRVLCARPRSLSAQARRRVRSARAAGRRRIRRSPRSPSRRRNADAQRL